jgi:competence protein ComEC
MARLRRERVLLLALLAAVIIVWWLVARETRQDLTITVLDVGQGDCILVQAPGGRTMLVDAGGRQGQEASGWDIGSQVVVPALMARGVRRIDVLVITHPHEDHIGGALAVLDAVPVGLVLDPMLETDSETYRDLLGQIREQGIAHHRATAGQRLNLGRGVYADVLNPPEVRLSDTGSDLNDNSVVLRLVYGAVSVLLAADIDEVGAYRMAWLGEAVDSTILKVPHHGAPDPAVPEFIDAASPDLSIITVGYDSPHGHPSDEMLRELARVGSKIMSTDRSGAITVKIRPPEWWAVGSSRRAPTHVGSAGIAPTAGAGVR